MPGFSKKFKKIFCLLIIILIGSVGLIAGAAQINLSSPGQGVESPAGMVARAYQIALGFAGVAAFGVAIYGAIKYTISGAIPSQQKEAKEWIFGAVWGIVLLLAAYLILYTINPDLVNLRDPGINVLPTLAPFPSSTAGQESLAGFVDLRAGSDAEIREDLIRISDAKIRVNKPAPQTSLDGIRLNTVQGILSLWENCGQCDLVITGGTESGHESGTYSHDNGYKIDLRPNSALDNAINNRIAASCQIPPPANSNCAGTDGNIYRYETDHWDVCFQCR